MQNLVSLFFWIALLASAPASSSPFRVGYAQRDITPQKTMPMWGYGARHDALSTGVRDPLYAKGVVIDASDEKLAIIGLDLGRSPGEDSFEKIREAVREKAGVGFILMSGSHTHHGPVIELRDEEGKGKGKFDDAVEYAGELESALIAVIVEAASNVQEARMGWGSKEVPLNRNRHSKIAPKPVDPELAVVRFDDLEGDPIAILVNFAAHPTMLDAADLRYSAEYPGAMMATVEKEMETRCFFMQGAAGDLSPNRPQGVETMEEFGKVLGEEVIAIARGIETATSSEPAIQGENQIFEFKTRIDFRNPFTKTLLGRAFFPELAECIVDLLKENRIRPTLTTILLNGKLALVGGSGEFFCNHSNRLKQRSRAEKTLFFGYCNGHHLYFPTIEAAAEGGYGADPAVSWVTLGAGEEMMNQALITIYTMMGKLTPPLVEIE